MRIAATGVEIRDEHCHLPLSISKASSVTTFFKALSVYRYSFYDTPGTSSETNVHDMPKVRKPKESTHGKDKSGYIVAKPGSPEMFQ